ncbi:hypothetical protein PVL29_013420 [Vitis rotundifolia]|uniref:S-protein homolog n=1 Tax=Vitis rotundifolia TaxID=103349 RepID=A0AA39DNH5_VITRO|nr:hypothetical protein PVL29_013420 [Vitis rotundifolia]
MSFLSGDTQAQQQGYREDGWLRDIFRPKFKILIDNRLRIPLAILCHSEDENSGNQVIQPGRSYSFQFRIYGFLILGPTVYCNMRWGPSSLEFTAYDGWRDRNEVGLHYSVNRNGIYINSNGQLSKFIEWV